MTTITLPPLPEPMHGFYATPMYSPDQLRARDLEVARLVLEAAANACEAASTLHRNQYKGRAPYPNPAVKAYDPYLDGLSDGAGECADTIRNLEVKHHE
jgi:hypothetical protein